MNRSNLVVKVQHSNFEHLTFSSVLPHLAVPVYTVKQKCPCLHDINESKMQNEFSFLQNILAVSKDSECIPHKYLPSTSHKTNSQPPKRPHEADDPS